MWSRSQDRASVAHQGKTQCWSRRMTVPHPGWWVVPVDGVGAVHPEDRDDGDGGVADPVLDPGQGERSEAFDGAGADGVVGQVREVGVQVEPHRGVTARRSSCGRGRRRRCRGGPRSGRCPEGGGLGVELVVEVGEVGGVADDLEDAGPGPAGRGRSSGRGRAARPSSTGPGSRCRPAPRVRCSAVASAMARSMSRAPQACGLGGEGGVDGCCLGVGELVGGLAIRRARQAGTSRVSTRPRSSGGGGRGRGRRPSAGGRRGW